MKLNLNSGIYLIILWSLLTGLWSCGHNEKSVEKSPAINVEVHQVEKQTYRPTLKVSGIVGAQQAAVISSRLMGRVEKIYFKIGDEIKAGNLLISLKSKDIEAKREQAEAKIKAAESNFNTVSKNYNRMKNLYEKESISLQEMEASENELQGAKAALKAAEQMKAEVQAALEDAKIKAPYSGVLVNRFIEEGNMALPGKPLLAIEQSGNFEVKALIPETYITQIISDSAVEVTIKSMQRKVEGRIMELSSSAENTGGQFVAKISLSEIDFPIRSGMFAEVELPLRLDEKDSGIFIPESLLVEKGELRGVYTLSESNTAILRWLKLGQKRNHQYEVLSGLSGGEKIILPEEEKIYNGVTVTVN